MTLFNSILKNAPDSLKLSSTGAFAVVSVKNGNKYDVNIYTSSLQHRHTLSSADDRFSVVFSSNEKAMAYAQGSSVQIFDTATFTNIQTLRLELNGTYAISNDLKYLVTLHDSDLIFFNLKDGSKTTTKTSLSSYYMAFSRSGDYVITYNFGSKGADVISRATGSLVRHVRIERGISYLLISGASGLCRNSEGNMFMLDVDF